MSTETRKPARKSGVAALVSGIHVFLYKLSGGRVGGDMMGLKIVVMNVVGRRTGKVHPTPVVGIEIDGQIYVAASHAGAPIDPVWFLNLTARPDITFLLDGKEHKATAEVVEEPERSRLFTIMCERAQVYADSQKKTTRVIPVVRLKTGQNG